jgi:thiamine biosynthesis lipoprotein
MKAIVRIFSCFFAVVAALSCSQRASYITITGFAQGGTYTVKFNSEGVSSSPQQVRDSIDAILRCVDNSLSGYNKKSLLSRFNAGETITPDPMFVEIYEKAQDVYSQTIGAVDVAAGPLFDIWGFGFANDSLPSPQKVQEVMTSSGMSRLKKHMALSEDGSLNPADLLVEPGDLPKLNYNAIAQGYSCDVVARYLYSIGVKDMLVDIGEIFCDGVNPSGQPWTLGIDRPVDGNNELGAQIQGIFRAPAGPHGIVTSGNYRKFYVRDGKKYAHTVDPRTGYPVDHTLLSATIVAPDATMADAYATYCMVIGLDASREFLESRPDLEGCLIYDDNGLFRTWTSSSFVLEESAL